MSSFKKVDIANTQIIQQGCSGIWVDTLEFFTNEGEVVHIDDTRTAVNNAQKALYEKKQGKNKEEKLDFELVKSAQATAKLNSESEPLVQLKMGNSFNNVVLWLLQII